MIQTRTERERGWPSWFWLPLVLTGGILGALPFLTLLGLLRIFTIPSVSNVPSLRAGDYITIECYDLACRFPDLPKWVRPTLSEPAVGDMAAFRKPTDLSVDYIKRIVGMPGDSVQMLSGTLYINDKAVPKAPVENFRELGKDRKFQDVLQFIETLSNGVRYRVLDRDPAASLDNTSRVVVPPGYYFVLGDNRDNSLDSRASRSGIGFVPRELMLGRAVLVLWSTREPGRMLEAVDPPTR